MKSTRKAKTHFVPRVVYRTAFVGVVPVCVAAAACSSSSSGGGTTLAVACAGYACAVGVQAFSDSGDAPLLSVAAIGFDGAPSDAHPASDSPSTTDSPILAVACLGFGCGVGIGAFGDGGNSG